ncbi:hypothetical protein [Mycolicibacterium arenosum]|uniref:Transposase n=1 Tax=Mycolicibacterium arenosum TaxID=2952157 RepID=A0ABT1MB28_9MYCO|nr:hypothetical protein [Mycolicibacterium sp. CAU 1645]MCP9274992.1 hypothetical protein [Mycolicibacterium sp. CAU 1645]
MPQSLRGSVIHRSIEHRPQQGRGFRQRQGREGESGELADAPEVVCRRCSRFTVSNGENHRRRIALHQLVYDEHRQIVEQVDVIDSQNNPAAGSR